MAVAPIAVIVQAALEIGPLDEARDVAILGGVKFPAILAQFRRHVGEVQRGENVLLGFAIEPQLGVARFLFAFEQAVFIEPQATFDGAAAHHDVVFLAAGEVGEGAGVFRIIHHPQVRLNAALEQHAGLGIAGG